MADHHFVFGLLATRKNFGSKTDLLQDVNIPPKKVFKPYSSLHSILNRDTAYYSAPHSTNFNLGTNDFTLEVIFSAPNRSLDHSALVSRGAYGSSIAGCTVFIDAPGNLELFLGDGTSVFYISGNSNLINDGIKRHIAWSINRTGNANLYIDGSLQSSEDISAHSAKSLDNISHAFDIGTYQVLANAESFTMYEVKLTIGQALTSFNISGIHKKHAVIEAIKRGI